MQDAQQPEQQIEKKYKPISKFFFVAFFILILLTSSFLGAVFGFLAGTLGQNIVQEYLPNFFNFSKDEEVMRQVIIQEDSAVTSVVEKASPSVVSIIVTKDIPKIKRFFFNRQLEEFFNQYFDSSQEKDESQQIGGGTGFFINENGMIITNRHIISDPEADYTVITNSGEEYKASILAKDPINDIAVLKIEGENFPVLELGNSDEIKIGQTAIAIGNSLGEFSNTVSRGIISGLGRDVTAFSGNSLREEELTDIIQTDAAINPGNSGGPLLNINGEVIGINVAIAQGAENIGFAIPSNQIRRVVEEVQENGKLSTPYIGVRYVMINEYLQKENNLPFDYGALLLRGEDVSQLAVIPGSPADKAGLEENNIILEIDGEKLTQDQTLSKVISMKKVGAEISLKIWHDGKEREEKVILEERPISN